ncbi:hypothetical protein ACT456_002357 [Enterococcus faecalis]
MEKNNESSKLLQKILGEAKIQFYETFYGSIGYKLLDVAQFKKIERKINLRYCCTDPKKISQFMRCTMNSLGMYILEKVIERGDLVS